LLGVPRSRAVPRQRNGGVIAGTPSRQGGHGVKAATGGRTRSGAAPAAERSAPRSPGRGGRMGEPQASGLGRRDGREPRGVSRARRRMSGSSEPPASDRTPSDGDPAVPGRGTGGGAGITGAG